MTSSHSWHAQFLSNGRWAVWATEILIIGLLSLKMGEVFSGHFPGSDDMLRLQQVRDLMAGQAWFNVDQSRFLTPEGGDIHWSRIPDIFLSAIILLAKPFVGQANAETIAMVLWPLSLAVVMLISAVTILKRLGAGLAGQIGGLIFIALSSAAMNFRPGRIDHHNLVVVLTLIALVAILSRRASMRSGIIAAFAIIAMLSTAIESLPYAATLILGFGLVWIVNGAHEQKRLTLFGISLAGFALVFYALDAPGIGPERFVCDAYGTSHMIGLVSGGLILTILAFSTQMLSDWRRRLIGGLVCGLLIVGLFVIFAPNCLQDPYADVSAEARTAWLSVVGEAQNLLHVINVNPGRAVWQYGFILAGLIAAAIMVWQAPRGLRLNRVIFWLLILTSCLATIWQIRGVTFSHVFAAIAGGWLAGSLFDAWREKGGAKAALLFVAGTLMVAPMSWAVAAQSLQPTKSEKATAADTAAECSDPEAFQALARDLQLNIFTPIDLGMPILVSSQHNIFSGPYHRNVRAIERTTEIFMGPTSDAQAIILNIGADHLLYCSGLPETSRYARLHPDGFAADLEAGRIPEWLVPDPATHETDVKLYRVTMDQR